MKVLTALVWAFAASLSAATCAQAEVDFESFNDPWRVYVGVLDSSTDAKVGINGDVVPPVPPIDIEEVLAVDDGKLVAWGG
jgi:hypothetical protein